MADSERKVYSKEKLLSLRLAEESCKAPTFNDSSDIEVFYSEEVLDRWSKRIQADGSILPAVSKYNPQGTSTYSSWKSDDKRSFKEKTSGPTQSPPWKTRTEDQAGERKGFSSQTMNPAMGTKGGRFGTRQEPYPKWAKDENSKFSSFKDVSKRNPKHGFTNEDPSDSEIGRHPGRFKERSSEDRGAAEIPDDIPGFDLVPLDDSWLKPHPLWGAEILDGALENTSNDHDALDEPLETAAPLEAALEDPLEDFQDKQDKSKLDGFKRNTRTANFADVGPPGFDSIANKAGPAASPKQRVPGQPSSKPPPESRHAKGPSQEGGFARRIAYAEARKLQLQNEPNQISETKQLNSKYFERNDNRDLDQIEELSDVLTSSRLATWKNASDDLKPSTNITDFDGLKPQMEDFFISNSSLINSSMDGKFDSRAFGKWFMSNPGDSLPMPSSEPLPVDPSIPPPKTQDPPPKETKLAPNVLSFFNAVRAQAVSKDTKSGQDVAQSLTTPSGPMRSSSEASSSLQSSPSNPTQLRPPMQYSGHPMGLIPPQMESKIPLHMQTPSQPRVTVQHNLSNVAASQDIMNLLMQSNQGRSVDPAAQKSMPIAASPMNQQNLNEYRNQGKIGGGDGTKFSAEDFFGMFKSKQNLNVPSDGDSLGPNGPSQVNFGPNDINYQKPIGLGGSPGVGFPYNTFDPKEMQQTPDVSQNNRIQGGPKMSLNPSGIPGMLPNMQNISLQYSGYPGHLHQGPGDGHPVGSSINPYGSEAPTEETSKRHTGMWHVLEEVNNMRNTATNQGGSPVHLSPSALLGPPSQIGQLPYGYAPLQIRMNPSFMFDNMHPPGMGPSNDNPSVDPHIFRGFSVGSMGMPNSNIPRSHPMPPTR